MSYGKPLLALWWAQWISLPCQKKNSNLPREGWSSHTQRHAWRESSCLVLLHWESLRWRCSGVSTASAHPLQWTALWMAQPLSKQGTVNAYYYSHSYSSSDKHKFKLHTCTPTDKGIWYFFLLSRVQSYILITYINYYSLWPSPWRQHLNFFSIPMPSLVTIVWEVQKTPGQSWTHPQTYRRTQWFHYTP